MFSNIGLRSGCHQVKIMDEDVHETSFRLRRYLDKCVLVFLDDILTYSRDEEELVEQSRLVLKLLKKHKLYAKLSRCDFYENRIHYLGHTTSDKGISIDPKNIKAIMSWPAPRKMKDVRYFVGLARYCRKFIERYSASKMEPMYRPRRPSCECVVP